ncbi:Uncharacterised protein [Legionella pneumophila subsp. pascullei]|uniref:Uncharacterized protein n=1 Tax=Legionella pneumophila subsp. pascullei TaxID=91890 RepID=A0AAX2IRP6_LEGPN|nr:Uncharacterised protein [Legionella pneumophila subsp. pascullei]VEH04085.1 Uncharacterised protein [Legionella pneumophila subsp. pascullei]
MKLKAQYPHRKNNIESDDTVAHYLGETSRPCQLVHGS